tara:strand:+ start:2083 stop:2535 length:453 start_codon:yes stop_codon:yes gene_type:complete
MGIKNLKSRFDRHQIQDPANTLADLPGQTVAGPNNPPTGPDPSDGNFFQNRGNNNSPFDVVKDIPFPGGPYNDQMVTLMQDTVKSDNHGYPRGPGSITYQPSPINSVDHQDLNINNMANPLVSPTLGIPINKGPNAPGLRALPYSENQPD